MLELEVLLLKDLDLAIGRVKPNLRILQPEHLVFDLGSRLKKPRVRIGVILLFLFVSSNPELSGLLLIGNHLIETLNPVVKLGFGELEGFFDAHNLGFKRRLSVQKFIGFLVKLLNLFLSLIEKFIFQVDDVGEIFVSIVLILKLSLDFVPGLIHCMQLVNQIVVVSPCLIQLLFHFVIIDLQSAKFQFELICLQLYHL